MTLFAQGAPSALGMASGPRSPGLRSGERNVQIAYLKGVARKARPFLIQNDPPILGKTCRAGRGNLKSGLDHG